MACHFIIKHDSRADADYGVPSASNSDAGELFVEVGRGAAAEQGELYGDEKRRQSNLKQQIARLKDQVEALLVN